jgi:hypothetical protein
VELAAVVAIDVALGRGALGEDDVVRLQFDVEVFEPVDRGLLGDRRAVDELLGAH